MSEKLECTKLKGKVAEILEKCYPSSVETGFVRCKGTTLPGMFPNYADRIREMDIRDDDVWVCSYPRSGTTWTQEMVWNIMNNVDLEAAADDLNYRFPFLELSIVKGSASFQINQWDERLHEYLKDTINSINARQSPRFIKSHLPFKLLPEKLQKNTTSAKIVYVARNSLDVCVSNYYHNQLLKGYVGDFETYCDLFLQGAVHFSPFWDHLLGFWNERDNPNLLILTYDEMKKDLKSVIYKTTKFLGKTLSDERIEKLLEHLSFDKMKNNPAVNHKTLVEIAKKSCPDTENASFIRCGKNAQWKTLMSPSIIERFQKLNEEKLKGTQFFS